MFNFDYLGALHLEISSRCNASCPMCVRNVYGGLKNPNFILSDWTFEDFKIIVNEEVINQIKHIMFCGHYGDPVINKDLPQMLKYVKESNPNVSVQIFTNGSIFKEEWWKDLINYMPANHQVLFGIDGLEDTHHLYRIGTDWNKIINNAKAFIDAGGKASWEFIRFKHNQHQVEQCRTLSKELGFDSFSVKDTSRYIDGEPYKVMNRKGEVLYYLEPPDNTDAVGITKDLVDNFQHYIKEASLTCLAVETGLVYIDASKKIYPCGFLGQTSFTSPMYNDIVDPIRQISCKENQEFFNKFETLDVTKTTIKEVMNSLQWIEFFKDYVFEENKKLITCARNCGRFSKPLYQFLDETTERTRNS